MVFKFFQRGGGDARVLQYPVFFEDHAQVPVHGPYINIVFMGKIDGFIQPPLPYLLKVQQIGVVCVTGHFLDLVKDFFYPGEVQGGDGPEWDGGIAYEAVFFILQAAE